MARFSDKQLAIARVYADAMILLAQKLGEVDVLHRELLDLADRLAADDVLSAVMTNPTVDAAKRAALIERLFRGRYSDLFVDSLQVMNGKGRMNLVRAACEAYREARDEFQGRVRVFVRSAVPLGDTLLERLTQMVERATGKTADVEEIVDLSLLGGLIVRIGDQKLDASVARKLAVIRHSLLDRASREIHSGRYAS